MTSETLGQNTSDRGTSVEVTNISSHGLWLFWDDREYFLPFRDFPWFEHATVAQLHHVQLLHRDHLYWPELDVDLSRDILEDLAKYPLVAKG